MSKKAIVAVLVILLAGGGIAFADYSPQAGFFGLTTANVEDKNGDTGNNGIASEENNGDEENGNDVENGGDNGDQMSDVAKAVHEALSGDSEIGPGHEKFGEKVSERARDEDIHLGEEVSSAAREANNSADVNDEGVNDNNNVNTSGNNSPGNSGNAFGNSSPGNSGNAGGGSSPGNSGNAGR